MTPADPGADRLLRLLDPDPERAAASYRDLYAKLVKYFEWRRCRPADAQDLAQETLRRGFTRIGEGTDVYAVRPAGYFFGIAQNVLREHAKQERRAAAPLDGDRAGAAGPIETADARILVAECLGALPEADRTLLWQYVTGDRVRLCRDLRVSAGGLRVRVHRVLERLRRQLRSIEEATK